MYPFWDTASIKSRPQQWATFLFYATVIVGVGSVIIGYATVIVGIGSVIVGYATVFAGIGSVINRYATMFIGAGSVIVGYATVFVGIGSVIVGYATVFVGAGSVIVGLQQRSWPIRLPLLASRIFNAKNKRGAAPSGTAPLFYAVESNK